jgi:hypothetical protein
MSTHEATMPTGQASLLSNWRTPVPSTADGGGRWTLSAVKEIVTVLIALAVVVVSGWLLIGHFEAITQLQVTDDVVKNSALYAATQQAHQQYLSDQKDVLNVAIGVLGVVLGYFFGRTPAESRAKQAEDTAKSNADAAAGAVADAKSAALKLDDVRATLRAIRASTTRGGIRVSAFEGVVPEGVEYRAGTSMSQPYQASTPQDQVNAEIDALLRRLG